jgi:nucleotide-binding universal stress UspA family protein
LEANMLFSTNNILVPVDFTDTCRKAISMALQIACGGRETTIHLLTVESNIGKVLKKRLDDVPLGDDLIEDTLESLTVSLIDICDDEFNLLAKSDSSLKKPTILAHVAGGDVLEDCLMFVNELEADLLIIGTHGRETGIVSRHYSTISEKLVEQAPCSVLVIKPDGYPFLKD